jgi:hypothetical protein
MGSTCCSAHVLWRGTAADAAKAISRAYTKLGYERVKKAPPEGGKRVIVLARPGEDYVSIYDSDNADLDNGELKDAALAASKGLKTAAVFTSLYDSDTFDFVVFNNGRQVDFLLTDAEAYTGRLKRLTDKARAAQWTKVFARPVTAAGIEQAANRETAFADDNLHELGGLVGLAGERTQRHYRDFEAEPTAITADFHFKRAPAAAPLVEPGRVALRNYYDRDNSRKLLVYPAAWPMPVDREELLTWLMLSEGAGFSGAAITVEIKGPEGLTIAKGIANGANFHNGQIVGGYELAKGASAEEAHSHLDTKRFALTPAGPASGDMRDYRAELPNLRVPAMTAQRSTQILVMLQLQVVASREGEWQVKVTLRPRAEDGGVHRLPAARVAAVNQTWLPVVSGLNPKAVYDTGDLVEDPAPDGVFDYLIPQYRDQRRLAMPREEARAALRAEQGRARERNYKAWLQDIGHRQSRQRLERGLDYPAVASSVAILRDDGQSTVDLCRSYLEDWLRPLVAGGGEVHLNAERQMTEALHVGKTKKTWPASAVLGDKVWAKLFDLANKYQSITVEFVPTGDEFPIAGMGLSASLRPRRAPPQEAGDPDRARPDYDTTMMALTLGKMRGRAFVDVTAGDTWNVFNWVPAHDACYRALSTSPEAMKAKLDAFAAKSSPLQAWYGESTWIPAFDRVDGYEATIYEGMSILNFFRGILLEQTLALTERRMSAPWCGNVLRMVAPHMWLCRGLIEQVDSAALERVASIAQIGGSYKIDKHAGCAMDDFELALLPILPIESARIKAPAT